MATPTISNLFIYPIKSTKGIALEQTLVTHNGFDLDRHFGIVNANNEMLTIRENPKLLAITTKVEGNMIVLSSPEQASLSINYKTTLANKIDITVFKEECLGWLLSNKTITYWLTSLLKEPCKLVYIDNTSIRSTGNELLNNGINYSDCYPIHLITTASVDDINNKLDLKITDNRYRPNIIITGTKPYEEEQWKSIRIGVCEFEVIIPTERCSLLTINPLTFEKSNTQEPLRTLAKNKRGYKKVNFGIYLIPKNTGIITKEDTVTIIQ